MRFLLMEVYKRLRLCASSSSYICGIEDTHNSNRGSSRCRQARKSLGNLTIVYSYSKGEDRVTGLATSRGRGRSSGRPVSKVHVCPQPKRETVFGLMGRFPRALAAASLLPPTLSHIRCRRNTS